MREPSWSPTATKKQHARRWNDLKRSEYSSVQPNDSKWAAPASFKLAILPTFETATFTTVVSVVIASPAVSLLSCWIAFWLGASLLPFSACDWVRWWWQQPWHWLEVVAVVKPCFMYFFDCKCWNQHLTQWTIDRGPWRQWEKFREMKWANKLFVVTFRFAVNNESHKLITGCWQPLSKLCGNLWTGGFAVLGLL